LLPIGYTIQIALKILIAEDCTDTAVMYKHVLEGRGHDVVITNNGECCLKIYHEESQRIALNTDATEHIQPFDVVLLDHKMPKINGMDVAKEILAVNPRQRIVFSSGHVKKTLLDSIRELNQPLEVLSKPFGTQTLIDAIEDKEIYAELQKLRLNTDYIKAANFRHEQIKSIVEILKKYKTEQ
jgi:CheY-like chemotaxis protein